MVVFDQAAGKFTKDILLSQLHHGVFQMADGVMQMTDGLMQMTDAVLQARSILIEDRILYVVFNTHCVVSIKKMFRLVIEIKSNERAICDFVSN